MLKLNYSRQRQAIKDYLASTKEHPTADTVYSNVKQQFPKISLGTVYRNLNLLTDIGEAVKISTPGGRDRFDGDAMPHNHFHCVDCSRMVDLDLDMTHIHKINDIAGNNFEGTIQSSSTLFYGMCGECK